MTTGDHDDGSTTATPGEGDGDAGNGDDDDDAGQAASAGGPPSLPPRYGHDNVAPGCRIDARDPSAFFALALFGLLRRRHGLRTGILRSSVDSTSNGEAIPSRRST
jgi:hypothetical protein